VNTGLLILRLFLAALLFGHATQKLLGWFSGNGFSTTAAIFAGWGFRPPKPMVLMAAASELTGVALIATGLLQPFGSAAVVGTMIVAASPSASKGLWAHLGGCEVPVLYAGMAGTLAFTGPGRYSLDHVLTLDSLAGAYWGLGAVVVGALAAIPMLLRRRAVLRGETATA
jgi:putative oxidoreductase